MKLILALSFAVLMGCSTMEPTVRTVTVEVPVRVPCNVETIPTKPYSFSEANKEMSIDDKVKLLLSELLEREATEKELRAALEGCKK